MIHTDIQGAMLSLDHHDGLIVSNNDGSGVALGLDDYEDERDVIVNLAGYLTTQVYWWAEALVEELSGKAENWPFGKDGQRREVHEKD